MQNKFPTIKDRILYLAEIKGFGKKNFCEKIGMSYGSFTGQAKNTPLNSNAIANILCIVPDVNLHWRFCHQELHFCRGHHYARIVAF